MTAAAPDDDRPEDHWRDARYAERKAAWVAANVAQAPPIGPCGLAELDALLNTSGAELGETADSDPQVPVTCHPDDNSVTERDTGSEPAADRGMSAGAAP